MPKCIYIYVLPFLMLPLCHNVYAQKEDTLFLRNGQVLVGQIKEMNIGYVTIDEYDLNMLHIKTSKIITMSTGQLLRIETIDKKIHFGHLRASSKRGKTIIVSERDSIEVALNEINTLLSFSNNFFKRLNGEVSAGYSYTRSSHVGRLNADVSALYTTRHAETSLSMSGIATIDSSIFSRDRESVELINFFNITPTWFIATAANYQRNIELSVARRFQEVAGMGSKLFLQKTSKAVAITGLAFNQERSTEGMHLTTLELPVLFQFNFFKFQHPNLQLSSTQNVYFGITEKNRIRYDTDTNVTWQLARRFSIKFEFYTNYDSKPPVENSHTIDYGTVLSLSWRF